jgi:hypothetical protein
LGVRLGTFLDDQTSEAGPVICRKGEADDTIGFSNNATHARQHMHYHSLSKSKVDRHMEPFIIDIDANDEKDFFLSAHEGEEFIMVLKGELEISYGKSNYRLKEGVKDENGNYRITGRIKDMIIRGGENIYPREIEEFLYKMPGIKDVQVAGVPSKKYGEAVGAFIILHEGYTMNEFDVREFCQGKIARYKIPKYIFFVKEFPMTGSGKIQKFKLKDLSLKLCAEQGIEII